jgi:uncharacterized membrane protein
MMNTDYTPLTRSARARDYSEITSVLKRNIRTMDSRRASEDAHATLQQRLSDPITRFAGSMASIVFHGVVLSCWIVGNIGWIGLIRPWDPSFVVLGMAASVEAIFLTTFVLMSQNRMSVAAVMRADLDLQINLLAEHEVTKLVALVSALTDHFGVRVDISEAQIEELKQDVKPEAVLDEIESGKKD